MNPDFPFRILSHSFGEKSDFSPKLQDKISNGKPGFEAVTACHVPSLALRSLPNFILQLWRKIHGCEIKSGSGLHGMMLSYSYMYIIDQILSDENRRRTYDHTGETSESPQPRGPAPGHGFTVFQAGNTFHFQFNMGGPQQRSDGVSTKAFFDTILPGSHHKPFLLNFHHEFCMQCMNVERIWEELRNVSTTSA